MYEGLTVGAVIPARDEADNIGAVVGGLLELRAESGQRVIDDLVVCDNGSKDSTAQRARGAGARVVVEDTPGYGIACLTALAALRPVDVVLFADGDRSCEAGQALDLLRAIAGGADMVVGSRALGRMEPGALSAPQIAGNRVASVLIRLLWGKTVTDLGPFRAIRADALRRLDMRDTAYGWTVEMQVKAIQMNLRLVETPVDSLRRRFGRSKVGGTIRGVMGASAGILGMIFRLRCRRTAPLARNREHADSGNETGA
ncbi:MAG: glycosyltransferase family 2 protein [Acidobacteria bacterium]|nr:glycosyltransferase family 2 protein [Acidobacteriota bacterium]